MLRLPKFEVASPTDVDGAIALLEQHGEEAMIIAGGTDLVPNMKHELFTPKVVVSLGEIEELHGIKEQEGALFLGAMTTLEEIALDADVLERAPALAQAAGLVAGPQLRSMGTLGGNVMLDTRCQWYNQTHFWRQALGYCLKKDGTVCHVVKGGKNCVAAASNDTAPALMVLDATLVFAGPEGRREVPVRELYSPDGIYNKKVRGEILVGARLPQKTSGTEHLGAYGKLRERGSIDFPLFGIAVGLEVKDERIERAQLAAVALQARPQWLAKAAQKLVGAPLSGAGLEEAVEATAALSYRQCKPLENIPGDAFWRHEMVPVYVRRTLQAAIQGTGPVHHI